MGTSRSLRVLTKGRFSTKKEEIQENLHFSCLIFRRGVCKSRAQHTSKMKMTRLQPGTSSRGRLVQPLPGQLLQGRTQRTGRRSRARGHRPTTRSVRTIVQTAQVKENFGSVKQKKKENFGLKYHRSLRRQQPGAAD